MKHWMYLWIFSLLFVFSCNNNNPPKTAKPVGPSYVRTGFYFLADEQDGIKMTLKSSGKTYYIAKTPFASIDNVIKTEFKKESFEGKSYTDLYMKFDAKGTKDLEEGSGNPLHPKVAIVIANELLYVIDNNARIKTGVMYITLLDYTQQEIEAAGKAMQEKR